MEEIYIIKAPYFYWYNIKVSFFDLRITEKKHIQSVPENCSSGHRIDIQYWSQKVKCDCINVCFEYTVTPFILSPLFRLGVVTCVWITLCVFWSSLFVEVWIHNWVDQTSDLWSGQKSTTMKYKRTLKREKTHFCEATPQITICLYILTPLRNLSDVIYNNIQISFNWTHA